MEFKCSSFPMHTDNSAPFPFRVTLQQSRVCDCKSRIAFELISNSQARLCSTSRRQGWCVLPPSASRGRGPAGQHGHQCGKATWCHGGGRGKARPGRPLPLNADAQRGLFGKSCRTQVPLLHDRRNYDRALRTFAHAARCAILFLTSVGSLVTLFEARGIEAVKIAMGVKRTSWRRGTARFDRYCVVVPDRQKACKIRSAL